MDDLKTIREIGMPDEAAEANRASGHFEEGRKTYRRLSGRKPLPWPRQGSSIPRHENGFKAEAHAHSALKPQAVRKRGNRRRLRYDEMLQPLRANIGSLWQVWLDRDFR
ncbi:MAG: hypothetical protein ACLRSW_00725 [Christensenellaceae bacterium]